MYQFKFNYMIWAFDTLDQAIKAAEKCGVSEITHGEFLIKKTTEGWMYKK